MRFLRECRTAFRQIAKERGFSTAAILTLGLSTAAMSAMFSLVNSVLLRPLPFPQPDRLVSIQLGSKSPDSAPAGQMLSYPDFFDFQHHSLTVSRMASFREETFILTGVGPSLRLSGQVVSAGFFRVLEVQPALGRDFRPQDDEPGSRVAVISHELWQSTFGASPDIVGKLITLNGNRFEVVGVLPPGTEYPIEHPRPAIWTTLAFDSGGPQPFITQRQIHAINVIGRLAPQGSLNQARAELNTLAHNLSMQYPDSNRAYPAVLMATALQQLVEPYRPALRVLFAAVVLLLLLASMNVAALLLARSAHRRAQVAVRMVLGASRWHVISQILVQSVVLALCGGAAGLLLSIWVLRVILALVPESVPRIESASIDPTVVAFAFVTSVITGLLFGVLPAWRMSRTEPWRWLRTGVRTAGSRTHNRVLNGLVVAQTAISLVVLVGCGLLIRSFVHILRVDPGFDPRNVLVAEITLPNQRYSPNLKVQFYQSLLAGIQALPGVRSVAAGWPLPMSGDHIGVSFEIEGRPDTAHNKPSASVHVVTPGYFQTLGIKISGREFTWADTHSSKAVVIINQSFARKYFPGIDPIGRRLRTDLRDASLETPIREVVGVVGDVRQKGLTAQPDPQYYLPWAQAIIICPTLCVRTAGNPSSLVGGVRSKLASLDPEVPLYHVQDLEAIVAQSAAQPRFQTFVMSCFASIALVLAALGQYSVLAYAVAQRTSEFGVRIALGASRGRVLRVVMGRGCLLGTLGLLAGLSLASALSRYMASMLYGVTPLDALTIAGVVGVLSAATAAASAVPALRATQVDPVTALRSL